MSFILDALKKSESERHRQSGPVLMDVRIAPPRRRIPPWAWVIAAVLLVNLAVLAWLLWLSPTQDVAPAPTTAAVATVVPPAALPVSQPTAATPPAVQTAAPVVDASTALAPAAASAPTPEIDIGSLPKVADMVAAGIGLPELRLSLHVYDSVQANRYVLLNGSRLREGDFTPEGVRIVAIAPAGVVVEWRGRRMLLAAGG